MFASKLANDGLVDIDFSERAPFGIDDVALYPLFGPEVLDLMQRLVPAEAQDAVAVGLIVKAAKPGT